MNKREPCGFPGCIALPAVGGFCPPHAQAIVGQIRPDADRAPEQAREALRQLIFESLPDAETSFGSIEVTRLPVPALLDFHFHSPDAVLMLDEDLAPASALRVAGHQQVHVEQQRQRFRCHRYAGRLKRLRLPGSDGRIAPWSDVETSRDAYQFDLPAAAKDRLAAHTPRCRRCGRHALDLAWTYFATPFYAWQELAGMAGWMAICEPCHEQVALFIDRQN